MRSAVIIGVVCAAGASVSALGQTYNASVEFSPSQNPSGVWRYGLRPGTPGTFEPYAHTQVIDSIDFWDRDLPFPGSYPKIGRNGTSQTRFWGGPGEPVAPGEMIMHPGQGIGCVLRFTAPWTNRYTVVVQARASSSCSSATGVSLWADGTPLGSAGLGSVGSNASLDALVYRLTGQTIDIVVTDGNNGINCDHVGVSVIVSATPCGPADLGSAGGEVGSDGVLDNNDFIAFIGLFFEGDSRADKGVAGGEAGSDGAFDNNDFIAFINQFFGGCP